MRRAPAPHADSPSGTKGWRELFTTLGLSATIAGLFALGGTLLEARQMGHDERCKIAREIVGDETPNPALSKEAHGRLGRLAAARVTECLRREKMMLFSIGLIFVGLSLLIYGLIGFRDSGARPN